MDSTLDYGLTTQELSSLEKAAQWIAIGDISPNHLKNLLVGSLSDNELARKFSRLGSFKLQCVLTYLQERRA